MILSDNNIIKRLIGKQTCKDTKYKPSIYQLRCSVDGKELIYHTMTRELLLNDGLSEKDLIEHWFLVPEQLDEKSMWDTLRAVYEHQYPKKRFGRLKQCTILTTTACNANCSYCYETGIKPRTMSKETAMDIAEYIIAHSDNHVTLKWFGGEPTLNTEVIRTICEALKKTGKSYHSAMITNGSIIEDTKELKSVWNLKWVQITLDGTKNIYEKTKRYTQENMFDTVIGNIKKLLDSGIKVHCRLNVSLENAKDLRVLVEYLKDTFGQHANFFVYAAPLFEGLGNPPLELTDDERSKLYDQYIDLQEKIWELFPRTARNPAIKRNYCMADSGRSCVIMPGGELGLCQHHAEDEFYGTIYSQTYDFDVLDRWTERPEELEECRTCFYYPQCIRLKLCPNERGCKEEYRKVHEHKLKYMMRRLYESKRTDL